MTWRVIEGDCVEVMAAMDEASVDAIVTDPPYGLEFMGKEWDAPHKARIRERVDLRTNPAVGKSTTRTPESYTAGRTFQEWATTWAIEALRVLRPGGHLVAFGGTRTYHRLACAVEDAGFEIRDCVFWFYGSGFPKSLDVSKAIDKAAGAKREVLETIPDRWAGKGNVLQRSTQAEAEAVNITAPATDAARQWAGWGTALKPACEPIVLARKPLTGTVAANVQEHGTGALNVDGCRIGTTKDIPASPRRGAHGGLSGGVYGEFQKPPTNTAGWDRNVGRWPANVCLGCACDAPRLVCLESPFAGDVEANTAYARAAMADSLRRGEAPIASHLLYTQEGILRDDDPEERKRGIEAGLIWGALAEATVVYMDRGVSRGMELGIKRARGEGRAVIRRWLDGREELEAHASGCAIAMVDAQSGERRVNTGTYRKADPTPGMYGAARRTGDTVGFGDAGGASRFFYTAKASSGERHYAGKNTHPTVKPVALMRWCCRLVTPPGGLVFDPFMGSGSTGVAAQAEGFRFAGCELDAEMVETARRRIAGPLFADGAPSTPATPSPQPTASMGSPPAPRAKR